MEAKRGNRKITINNGTYNTNVDGDVWTVQGNSVSTGQAHQRSWDENGRYVGGNDFDVNPYGGSYTENVQGDVYNFGGNSYTENVQGNVYDWDV